VECEAYAVFGALFKKKNAKLRIQKLGTQWIFVLKQNRNHKEATNFRKADKYHKNNEIQKNNHNCIN